MEADGCYKFSTIRNYIARAKQKPIEIILDVGANVGDITLLMHENFPEARICGFEPVTEYFEIARQRTKHLPQVRLLNLALTEQHRFLDDLGRQPRQQATRLKLLKGAPEAGHGWLGGSIVLAEDHQLLDRNGKLFGFEEEVRDVSALTLEEFMASERIEEIDLLKLDCEGCEHSVLGCAELETLRRLRFIVGEYHQIKRFYGVMSGKLFQTHKVNLVGDCGLGAFFAERLDGEHDGILKFDKNGMLQPRPWLCDVPIDWHLFNEPYVAREAWPAHGLA